MIGTAPFAATAIAGFEQPQTPSATMPKAILVSSFVQSNRLQFVTFTTQPISIGDTPSFVVGINQVVTGTVVLTITKPGGSRYVATSPHVFTVPGRYEPHSYIYYQFSPGEIDTPGTWTATLKTGTINSTAASFNVS